MLGYVLASGALLRGKKKGMTAGSHLCWDDSKPSLFLLRGRAGKENTRGHALRSPPNRATARILFPKEKTGKEKKRSSCPGHPCPPLMAEKQVTGEEGRKGQRGDSWAPMACAGDAAAGKAGRALCRSLPQILPPHSRRVWVGSSEGGSVSHVHEC